MQGEPCEWPECPNPSLVGLNGRWYCIPHFSPALAQVNAPFEPPPLEVLPSAAAEEPPA